MTTALTTALPGLGSRANDQTKLDALPGHGVRCLEKFSLPCSPWPGSGGGGGAEDAALAILGPRLERSPKRGRGTAGATIDSGRPLCPAGSSHSPSRKEAPRQPGQEAQCAKKILVPPWSLHSPKRLVGWDGITSRLVAPPWLGPIPQGAHLPRRAFPRLRKGYRGSGRIAVPTDRSAPPNRLWLYLQPGFSIIAQGDCPIISGVSVLPTHAWHLPMAS